ncbi:SMP-30/gluconolactonase/LRE family protein [Macromonas nakdongensis]|uniref:SMP-30/gluconolactonase/LRE family protein n=1 Tax=Macromonas nakdongensis TaxID=1843082 RepID=UPI000C33462D|nr:SMP-30/gluconolactonase/LRE family protein [Macromonas nakdongensis]
MSAPTAPAWQRAHDTLCAQGDSPFWHAREERLYWVDVALMRLWRLHPRSGQAEHIDLPQTPGSVAPCRSGGLLLALRDGIYHLGHWNDLPRQIAAAPHDPARQRFAGGRCDPWGRFWVGTHVDAQDRAEGALYCLHTRVKNQPELRAVERGLLSCDGLAWSPDGKRLYWTDSSRHQVSTHAMSNPGQWPPQLGVPMPLGHFAPRPADWSFDTPGGYAGRPSGAAVDQAGRYWVAMHEGAQVLCLSPQGEVLARHPTPVQCPTALCFGDPDLRTLYLTSARLQRSPAELARWPDSGAVHTLRVDTPGLPVNLYWD